ncbi:MAG: hypothetical protein HP491_02165 [Nitrospira sp.]|nr:hypothetical protein [Nitrospira sp.]MBH0186241.1 hypothetical protein [Nitrospira sp.]
MVAMGHTNREIAASLTISVRTVEVHRFNLMRRLNARNVAQLLRQSLRYGLLPASFGNDNGYSSLTIPRHSETE